MTPGYLTNQYNADVNRLLRMILRADEVVKKAKSLKDIPAYVDRQEAYRDLDELIERYETLRTRL